MTDPETMLVIGHCHCKHTQVCLWPLAATMDVYTTLPILISCFMLCYVVWRLTGMCLRQLWTSWMSSTPMQRLWVHEHTVKTALPALLHTSSTYVWTRIMRR